MYHTCCSVSGVPKKNYLPLLTYRMSLARSLIQYGGAAARARHSPRIQFPLQNSKNDNSSEDELYEPQVKRIISTSNFVQKATYSSPCTGVP